jgi:two-component system phosphate regulon sensor histidine kinase PhoR
MKSTTIRRVVLLGVLAILGILSLQAYWIYESWSLENRTFDERARIALMEVAERIAQYNGGNLPSYEIVVRESPDYYVVNIDDVIDANVLEHYLESTFIRHALKIDFEYAVFDCHTKEMVYGNYCPMAEEESIEPEDQPLPKYDEFIYYFGVRFLGKQNFVFEEMSRVWTVTGILGLTLFFFAYAISVILGQKRYSEMQKDFINNMTHEFKTPISSIKLSSDFLLKAPSIKDDPRLKQYAQIIQDQNMRLNDQVEQVLSIAKLEKDQFKLKKESVELGEICRELVASHEMRVRSLEGSLTLDLPEEACLIQADPRHLRNVLNNLIDNAIKYSGEHPKVSVQVRVQAASCTLSVQDKGIGIAKEHLDRITDQFFRVPSGNIHDVKGFGLGLYYVKSICKEHGWSFMIESEAGEWTRASIQIPTEK